MGSLRGMLSYEVFTVLGMAYLVISILIVTCSIF
jgi:hypothetical protein